MKLYHGTDDRNITPATRALAIGVFDGVHLGHRKILSGMLREAKRRHLKPLVITFDPHPGQVLKRGSQPGILMSLDHRLSCFEKLGVAEALVIHFNKKISQVPREKFLENILIQRLGMRSLTVGHDFCFGHRGSGNIEFLKEESTRLKFRLLTVPALKKGRRIVSSTLIRQFVEAGDLKNAEAMLGRPVSVYGTVVRGRGRGKPLGFPTANLDPHHETLPPGGVYSAYGYLAGKKLEGVIHIGERPTFRDKQASLEVHFLNFHKNIYGKELELVFVKRLRGTEKFKNAPLLKAAIQRDIEKARQSFCFTKPVKASIL
jgi:riboflavin kinase/FMN adenylyltransferase